MAREATCFQCRHVLRVSPDARGRWLTCPRCLASVGNPYVLLSTEPPPAPAQSPPAAPPESPPDRMRCPWCEEIVQPSWRVCPYCERPILRPPPRGRDDVDDEARTDRRAGNVVLVVLGALLIGGAVLFAVLGVPAMAQSAVEPGAVCVVGRVAIGALVGGVVFLALGARSRAVTVISSTLGGVAVGAGVVLLVVLVACMTIVAAFANFLHTCQCK